MKIVFKKFSLQEYKEYNRWFKDKELRKILGGIDKEWLNYILEDEEGIEIAAYQEQSLISVIGLKYPSKTHKYYLITNIAVKPSLKNKGLGSIILNELLEWVRVTENEYWVSYVDMKNENAQRFFEKNGWQKVRMDKDGMIRYEYRRRRT